MTEVNIIILSLDRHRDFLQSGVFDPVDKSPLEHGDEVIVCGVCEEVMRRSTWENFHDPSHVSGGRTLPALPKTDPEISLFEYKFLSGEDYGWVAVEWQVRGYAPKIFLNNQKVDASGQTKLHFTSFSSRNLELRVKTLFGSFSKQLYLEGENDPPEIEFFRASPDNRTNADPITLSWHVTGAVAVILDGMEVPLEGSMERFPLEPTTYFLQAKGIFGQITFLEVTVEVDERPPEILRFEGPEKFLPALGTIVEWEVIRSLETRLSPPIFRITNDTVDTDENGKRKGWARVTCEDPMTLTLVANGAIKGIATQSIELNPIQLFAPALAMIQPPSIPLPIREKTLVRQSGLRLERLTALTK